MTELKLYIYTYIYQPERLSNKTPTHLYSYTSAELFSCSAHLSLAHKIHIFKHIRLFNSLACPWMSEEKTTRITYFLQTNNNNNLASSIAHHHTQKPITNIKQHPPTHAPHTYLHISKILG